MKTFILIFALITSITFCKGQNERHLKDFFKRSHYIENAKRINKVEPCFTKDKRIKALANFIRYRQNSSNKNSVFGGDRSAIHYININDDEYLDIIYIDSSGLNNVSIFQGLKDSFRLILEASPPNFLKELKFFKRKCIEVVLESIPYIDKDHSEMVYKLVKDSFELQSWRRNRDCTEKPSKYYKKAVKIKTLRDSCPLRENPKIDKGECFFEDGDDIYNKTSNIIGQFNRNTKGFCWAEKRDSKNALWFLVELPLKNKILTKEEIRNDPNYLNIEYYVGWIEASLVEKIE